MKIWKHKRDNSLVSMNDEGMYSFTVAYGKWVADTEHMLDENYELILDTTPPPAEPTGYGFVGTVGDYDVTRDNYSHLPYTTINRQTGDEDGVLSWPEVLELGEFTPYNREGGK